MTHTKVTYPLSDNIDKIEEINQWFNFKPSNTDEVEKEYKKAQELLNHLDKVRTIFSNKLSLKRRK